MFIQAKYVARFLRIINLSSKSNDCRSPRLLAVQAAPVLFTTGGKPSTWLPPGGLVEQNAQQKHPDAGDKKARKKQEEKEKQQKKASKKQRERERATDKQDTKKTKERKNTARRRERKR